MNQLIKIFNTYIDEDKIEAIHVYISKKEKGSYIRIDMNKASNWESFRLKQENLSKDGFIKEAEKLNKYLMQYVSNDEVVNKSNTKTI